MGILTIRKLADRSQGQRVKRYSPETGEPYLSDPDSDDPGQHSPWPLAGVQLVDAPDQTSISTTKVTEGLNEGWITAVGGRHVHRPGGPAGNPWQHTHTFLQADELVFRTVDGDVRYRVTHQPDKYAHPGDDTTPVTDDVYGAGATRVDWFYGLERIDA